MGAALGAGSSKQLQRGEADAGWVGGGGGGGKEMRIVLNAPLARNRSFEARDDQSEGAESPAARAPLPLQPPSCLFGGRAKNVTSLLISVSIERKWPDWRELRRAATGHTAKPGVLCLKIAILQLCSPEGRVDCNTPAAAGWRSTRVGPASLAGWRAPHARSEARGAGAGGGAGSSGESEQKMETGHENCAPALRLGRRGGRRRTFARAQRGQMSWRWSARVL